MSRVFGLITSRLFVALWLHLSPIQEIKAFILPTSNHHARSANISNRDIRRSRGVVLSSTSTSSDIQQVLDQVDAEHEYLFRKSPYAIESMSQNCHSDVDFEWIRNQNKEKVVARTISDTLFHHETLDMIVSALSQQTSQSYQNWSSTSQGVQRIALESIMDDTLRIKMDELLCSNLYPALRLVFDTEMLPTDTAMFVKDATVVIYNATQAQQSGYSGAFVPMVSQCHII